MTGVVKCLKIFLIVCNTALFLVGAAVLIIGGLRVFKEETTQESQNLKILDVVLMIYGGVFAYVGFLGCCGACTENTRMLKIYVGKVSGVCLLELISGLVFFFNLSELQDIEEAANRNEKYDDLLKGVAVCVSVIQVAAIIAAANLLKISSQEY